MTTKHIGLTGQTEKRAGFKARGLKGEANSSLLRPVESCLLYGPGSPNAFKGQCDMPGAIIRRCKVRVICARDGSAAAAAESN